MTEAAKQLENPSKSTQKPSLELAKNDSILHVSPDFSNRFETFDDGLIHANGVTGRQSPDLCSNSSLSPLDRPATISATSP
ncbi:hypothetical protein L596_014086 [Steinernema carpocapsae]|uniref:Uncharacterized protein n=1 Tax=Steinernema carpocapsae TaxID=34508 RepID=A0A4U5NBP4_STECR|nr:hypothetical protein L596_014086 [Steinernema carpocapsae]